MSTSFDAAPLNVSAPFSDPSQPDPARATTVGEPASDVAPITTIRFRPGQSRYAPVKIDLPDSLRPASIKFARRESFSERDLAALPDMANHRRQALAAARRCLNDELSSCDAALDAALDIMISVVSEGRAAATKRGR